MPSRYDKLVWPTCLLFGAAFWFTFLYLLFSTFGMGWWQPFVAIMAAYTCAFLACLTTAIIFVTLDWVAVRWRNRNG